MTIGLIGRKAGMTRVFTDAGDALPVTVIEALPNRVVQIKDASPDGYRAVQVTVGTRRASRLTKPVAGHYAKPGVLPGEGLIEFRLAEGEGAELKTGAELKVDMFEAGQVIEDRTGGIFVRLLRRRVRPRVPLRNRVAAVKLRKGVYLIPSLFTAGNLICGFFSIISTFNGDYVPATLFIILANILDGLDGYAARLTRSTSQFGVEFDSLADVVSFGVAPAILVYFWALVPWGTWGWLAACTYVVCGALRLSRFNVQSTGPAKGHFVGLPIPAAAEMIAAIVLMYYFLGGEGAPNKHITLLLVIYGLAGLMVSGFPYFSLKNSALRKKHPFWMLVSGFILITLIIAEPQIMFFMIFLLYTLSGPLLWCLTTKKRRRERRVQMAEAKP